MAETMNESLFSSLPGVEKLLNEANDLVDQYGHQQVTEGLREELNRLRMEIKNGISELPSTAAIIESTAKLLDKASSPSLKPVINLTGTVLHTNLGRAALPNEAIEAMIAVAGGYSNLEFDLDTAKRGDRDTHIESLLLDITGAEAATVVNNNAAAVMLTLNTLADEREVPVSRGELVEIGGSFRIPEVMKRSGCKLVEVGATNRTHAKDYESAISQNTALLMKVHTSNYEIQGFTESVSDERVAQIAHANDLPFVTDLGSGTLVDLTRWGLPYEPTVEDTLKAGADLITFSGDKLLGGPQCGIIVGKSELIARIKKNPMKRALRVDKMTIAAIFEVLKLYLDPDSLTQRLPTLKYLTRSVDDIRQLADSIFPVFEKTLGHQFDVAIVDCESQIGSGSLPVNLLSSSALKITPQSHSDTALTNLASKFRSLTMPVLGRVHDGSLFFDLRTLDSAQMLTDQLSQLTLDA